MRNKTSIFSTYALLSVVGFGGFWWFGGTKSGESLNTSEAFLAFYSFLSTTVVFYVLASQKQSIDTVFDTMADDRASLGREIESVYRYVDGENEKVARRIDSEVDTINNTIDATNRAIDSEVDSFNRELDRITIGKTEECCKAL